MIEKQKIVEIEEQVEEIRETVQDFNGRWEKILKKMEETIDELLRGAK